MHEIAQLRYPVYQWAVVRWCRCTGIAGERQPAVRGVKVSFSASLRAMPDQVNAQQLNADRLSQRFAMGDDRVNLSDVMIERQKASLSLQATVQVRNKLVNAYHEIMNRAV